MASPFERRSNRTAKRTTGSKVNRKLSKAAGAEAGDEVTLELAPGGTWNPRCG